MFAAIASILWLLLPAVVWLSRKRIPLFQQHVAISFAVAVLCGWLLYVGAVRLQGAEIKHALYKFDLDGDREFSDTEMTADAREAMRRYSNDTGRALAPLVAAPATLILTSAWFLLLGLGNSLSRRIKRGSEPKLA